MNLVAANWPDALARAATGLREAVDRGGVGVLPGGRLTEEDAYAYAKFARVALGTNDIDSALAPGLRGGAGLPRRAGRRLTAQHVSYASLERAPAVLLVGLRARGRVTDRLPAVAQVHPHRAHRGLSVAALASDGLVKLGGTLIARFPVRRPRRWPASDAQVVGALSPPAR